MPHRRYRLADLPAGRQGIPLPAALGGAAATLTIATRQSLRTANADYVVDGVRDDVEIQHALNRLSDISGGRLVLLDGTYNIGAMLSVASNVIVQGVGWASILKLTAGAGVNLFTIGAGSVGVTFLDLDMDGNDARTAADSDTGGTVNNGIYGVDIGRLFVQRCRIRNFKRGLHFSTAGGFNGNHFISDCWITTNQVHGVYLATDSQLMGCFVGENGNVDTGDVEPGAPNDQAVNKRFYCNVRVDGWDSRINNCHIWGGADAAATRSMRGIYSYYAEDLKLIGCVVEEHRLQGLYAVGRFNSAVICDNYFEDNSQATLATYDAILVDSIAAGQTAEGCLVVGNRFGKQELAQARHRNCVRTGALCNRWVIVGNNMYLGYDATAGALSLTGANNIVRGNIGALDRHTVTAGITAATPPAQGSGALTADVNEVSTVANANDCVTLPPAAAGLRVVIINNAAANTLRIYPASGDNLGAGVDTFTTLAAGSNVVYQAYDATNWESI